MRKPRTNITTVAGSANSERAAKRLRGRANLPAKTSTVPARATGAAIGSPNRELTATLNRIGNSFTGSRGSNGQGSDLISRLLRVTETGKLDLVRTALAGIDTALARLIPRLHGFGSLLRQVLGGALKRGARSLLGGLFGADQGAGRSDSGDGGGIFNLLGRGRGGSLSRLGGLFSNPWTAVIGGGIVAGLALWNHFRHSTEKKLRETIRSTYGVDIREMQVLQQIKALGEQAFGRGQVSRRLLDTIRLEPVKQLVQSYAESTGQTARGLITAAQLGDPGWVGNRYIRGADVGVGSQVPGAGAAVSRRGFSFSTSPANGGGSATRGPGDGGLPPVIVAAWTGLMARIATQLERWEAVPASQVVANGASGAAAAIGNAVITVANDDWRFNDRLSNKRGEKR